jgi:(E)-4-hydroxy-3-methylbut-2-enyl-diphosphate synthase
MRIASMVTQKITIQSMTTTKTADVEATTAQIKRLETIGCDIIRVAVPDTASADAISKIKENINIPLVADIHFDHRLALRAIERGADKIRINPGNIGGSANVKAVADACNRKNIPIRIGVNSGSLEKGILEKHGGVTAEAMVESVMGHVKLLKDFDFDNIWLSAKTSNVPLTVKTYRLLREQTDYPLHIGITEAGTEYNGIIKNAMGIGALLLDGIGDTIRVSLTAEPEKEVEAAKAILMALGLRPGIDIISCPTCGRCKIDLIKIVQEVESRVNFQLSTFNFPTTIAIMGCSVNGPGEASQADYGIAGSDGEGLIFAKGKIIKKVPMDELIDELLNIIRNANEPTKTNPLI